MTRCMHVLLILCCLQILPANAADPEPVAAPAPAATAPRKPEDTAAAAEARRTPAAERFEPSEQISEDLSVSFPADI